MTCHRDIFSQHFCRNAYNLRCDTYLYTDAFHKEGIFRKEPHMWVLGQYITCAFCPTTFQSYCGLKDNIILWKDHASKVRTILYDKFFRTCGFDSLKFFRKSFCMIATWHHIKTLWLKNHKNNLLVGGSNKESTHLHDTFVDIDACRSLNPLNKVTNRKISCACEHDMELSELTWHKNKLLARWYCKVGKLQDDKEPRMCRACSLYSFVFRSTHHSYAAKLMDHSLAH